MNILIFSVGLEIFKGQNFKTHQSEYYEYSTRKSEFWSIFSILTCCLDFVPIKKISQLFKTKLIILAENSNSGLFFYDIAKNLKGSFVYNWPVELGLGRNWHKDKVMTISEVSKKEIWEFFSRLFSIMKASLVTAIVLLKTSKAKLKQPFFSLLETDRQFERQELVN